jgi:uncharacterized protein YodC (DUF2158 family)
MAKFKKGDQVKLAVFVPQGPVKSMRMDEDGNVQCMVEWTDADGGVQHRWFNEDELVAAS